MSIHQIRFSPSSKTMKNVISSSFLKRRKTDITSHTTSTIDYSAYQFEHALDLKFSEDLLSLTPDCYQIRRMDNRQNLFFLNTALRSNSNKKVLYDAETDIPIYKMKFTRLESYHQIQLIDYKTDKIAYTIEKAPVKAKSNYQDKIHVWKGSSIIDAPHMMMEGQFSKKRFRVWNLTKNGIAPAAVVKRQKFNFSNAISGKVALMVTIEKDVDTALIVMLMSVVIENWRKSSKQ